MIKKTGIYIILMATTLVSFAAGNAFAKQVPENFADLIPQLMPAVVNISTTQKPSAAGATQTVPMPQFPEGSPFEEFNDLFEKFGNPGMEDESQSGRKIVSLGSGFIIDPSGYIVTNNHVIAEAEEITVILSDDKRFIAKVIGTDTKTDLALLKVDTKKTLPSVKFGDSNSTRVGEWILAIGNPFGLGGTVTSGIISARARDINAGPFDDFLQTDASINKGNSGGPMFNLQGEVIGINTAIYSPSGGSVGIGFATPSALAAPVIEQLRKSGKIQRAWLGVKIQSITDDIAESLALKNDNGALIVDITKGSPADKAGLMVGDIILTFDDKEIAAMRKLPRIVAETQIGKKVDVTILRKDARKTVTVTLGELNEKEEEARVKQPSESTISGSSEVLGITVASISPSLSNRFNIPADVKGLVIIKLDRNSEALKRGIQPGDVIIEVNQQPVVNPDVFSKIVKAAKTDKRKSILLLLNRQGQTQFMPLPITYK